MEETRNMSVKVIESLHCKIRQEVEETPQTMSQFIETVLQYYFDRKDGKEMSANKRTLAFQVSEEFYNAVQEFIKANKMKLKDFGATAMRRMMEDAAPADIEAPDQPEQASA